MKFCGEAGLTPVPASEEVLCLFVAHLQVQHLKHRTIKSYLSAVRFLHVMEGQGNPFEGSLHRLEYILKGVKWEEAASGSQKRSRLPISPNILRTIKGIWNRSEPTKDEVMLWAACCLGFFGFLRAGEFTVPDDKSYDPTCHLSFGDVAVDSQIKPQVVRITVKQSKTDPFRKGIDIYIGRTGNDLCPVAALLSYLAERGSIKGPFFRFQDGRPLTRQRLVDGIRKALRAAGLDDSKYCGRIGAAERGMEDSMIKTLGRWSYLDYIKIPRGQLAGYSHILAS